HEKNQKERTGEEQMDAKKIEEFRAGCTYNLVLIGFMGAGKSTVARCLKEQLGMEIVEMDQEIERQQSLSIPEIFERYGEEYFRNLETKLLIEMQKKSGVILSCGGGVVMREENVREMKKNGYVVLLTADPQTIYERVKENDDRPLLKGRKNVEYIAQLMETRREKYEAAADLVLQTDGKKVPQICEELIIKLMEMDKRDV
ncbi:MAG: shikimate kinase, partial [[Ruminococcus] gnavus]|nr:shikimate kinase [Mediterraneibacter gnavus]